MTTKKKPTLKKMDGKIYDRVQVQEVHTQPTTAGLTVSLFLLQVQQPFSDFITKGM